MPASGPAREKPTLRPNIVWPVLALIYAAFFGWYTSFGGPLTTDEVEHYITIMQERGTPAEDLTRIRAFLESDTGDDFAMMNIIELREPPDRVGEVQPGETATDVLGRYMEYMWPELIRRAGHPVLMGSAASEALDVWGIENAERWSMGAYMRYRSRRDMMEVATNPEFSGRHEYKIAAMWKTIAFPVDPWFHLGDPRLLLALILGVTGFALSWLHARRQATGG